MRAAGLRHSGTAQNVHPLVWGMSRPGNVRRLTLRATPPAVESESSSHMEYIRLSGAGIWVLNCGLGSQPDPPNTTRLSELCG